MFCINKGTYGQSFLTSVKRYDFPVKKVVSLTEKEITVLKSNKLFTKLLNNGTLVLCETVPIEFQTQAQQLTNALRQIEELKSGSNASDDQLLKQFKEENEKLKEEIAKLTEEYATLKKEALEEIEKLKSVEETEKE